ncbi:MAG: hypothetical protein PHE56_16245 [Bacteroidales bacterium]|nr:hypothetical protein [Bacteroidales bacterium]
MIKAANRLILIVLLAFAGMGMYAQQAKDTSAFKHSFGDQLNPAGDEFHDIYYPVESYLHMQSVLGIKIIQILKLD